MSASGRQVLPQLNKKLQLPDWSFFVLNNIWQDLKCSERRPSGRKSTQDVCVSERNRPVGSRHDVCERKASPAPAKKKKLQLLTGVFLFFQQPVQHVDLFYSVVVWNNIVIHSQKNFFVIVINHLQRFKFAMQS